jgi:pyruvate,water dikinase
MSIERPYILWLDEPTAISNPALGGKFSSLARSTADGLPVPPGFGITTFAYRDFMAAAGLEEEARRVRCVAADLEPEHIAAETRSLIAAIKSAPLPSAIEAAVREAYGQLCARTASPAVPVAVRSSGESEDLAGASFAGQYETFLWITGADQVLDYMRRCWAGMYGDAVLSYRHQGSAVVAKGDFGICVGIQHMVEARAAGVLFTLDPITGDRSKISIETCWGLGEGVVKGDITPSQFLADKVMLTILRRRIANQVEEYRFDPDVGTVGVFSVESARRDQPPLSEQEAVALAALGKKIEKDRGAPQDIEWAVGVDGRIHVLQVRPETVWSTKQAKATASITSPISHVLSRMSGGAFSSSKAGGSKAG